MSDQNMKHDSSDCGVVEELLSAFYDEELATSMERMVALVEPALLLFMAVIIALVVFSVYFPLFQMYSLVGN